MASVERTAYPRFKRSISSRELHESFSPTPGTAEVEWARESIQAMTNKVEAFHEFSAWLMFASAVLQDNDPGRSTGHRVRSRAWTATTRSPRTSNDAARRWRATGATGRRTAAAATCGPTNRWPWMSGTALCTCEREPLLASRPPRRECMKAPLPPPGSWQLAVGNTELCPAGRAPARETNRGPVVIISASGGSAA